ncbi:MAG: helicase-related protein [Candidatus Magnetobacterium sp. LHC-1]
MGFTVKDLDNIIKKERGQNTYSEKSKSGFTVKDLDNIIESERTQSKFVPQNTDFDFAKAVSNIVKPKPYVAPTVTPTATPQTEVVQPSRTLPYASTPDTTMYSGGASLKDTLAKMKQQSILLPKKKETYEDFSGNTGPDLKQVFSGTSIPVDEINFGDKFKAALNYGPTEIPNTITPKKIYQTKIRQQVFPSNEFVDMPIEPVEYTAVGESNNHYYYRDNQGELRQVPKEFSTDAPLGMDEWISQKSDIQAMQNKYTPEAQIERMNPVEKAATVIGQAAGPGTDVQASTGNKLLDTGLGAVGGLMSLLQPNPALGGQSIAQASGQAGQLLEQKLAPKVVGAVEKVVKKELPTVAKNAMYKGVENAGTFGTIGALGALNQNAPVEEVVKQAATGMGVGGLTGGLTSILPAKVTENLGKNIFGRAVLRGIPGSTAFAGFGAVDVANQVAEENKYRSELETQFKNGAISQDDYNKAITELDKNKMTPGKALGKILTEAATGLLFDNFMHGISKGKTEWGYTIDELKSQSKLDEAVKGIRMKYDVLKNRNVKDLVPYSQSVIRDPNFKPAESGYEEFKGRPGIWVKYDPKSGGLVDMYYETVIRRNQSGDLEAVPLYSIKGYEARGKGEVQNQPIQENAPQAEPVAENKNLSQAEIDKLLGKPTEINADKVSNISDLTMRPIEDTSRQDYLNSLEKTKQKLQSMESERRSNKTTTQSPANIETEPVEKIESTPSINIGDTYIAKGFGKVNVTSVGDGKVQIENDAGKKMNINQKVFEKSIVNKVEPQPAEIKPEEVKTEPVTSNVTDIENKAIEKHSKKMLDEQIKNYMHVGSSGRVPEYPSQETINDMHTGIKNRMSELVDAVNNKDFETLTSRLHRGNKNSLNLFSDVTGLSTKTQKEIDANIRSLDPDAYDKFISDKNKVYEEKEATRAKEHEEKKAKEKQDAYNVIGESKIKYNNEIISFKDFVKNTFDNGFRVEKTNDYGGFDYIKKTGDGASKFPVNKLTKEQRNFLKTEFNKHMDEYIAADNAKEAAIYDSYSQEDKDMIEGLFGKKPKTKAAKDLETKINEADTVERLTDIKDGIQNEVKKSKEGVSLNSEQAVSEMSDLSKKVDEKIQEIEQKTEEPYPVDSWVRNKEKGYFYKIKEYKDDKAILVMPSGSSDVPISIDRLKSVYESSSEEKYNEWEKEKLKPKSVESFKDSKDNIVSVGDIVNITNTQWKNYSKKYTGKDFEVIRIYNGSSVHENVASLKDVENNEYYHQMPFSVLTKKSVSEDLSPEPKESKIEVEAGENNVTSRGSETEKSKQSGETNIEQSQREPSGNLQETEGKRRTSKVRSGEGESSERTVSGEREGTTREEPGEIEYDVSGKTREEHLDTPDSMGRSDEGNTASRRTRSSGINFRITPDVGIGEGGQKTKYKNNVVAIRLLKELQKENRMATYDEQKILTKYVGWGGIPQAFNEKDVKWSNEYKELKELFNEDEYRFAHDSMLNAHYTALEVIESMYDALMRMGFDGGKILEPAMGVGNFFGMLPEELMNSRLTGVELDKITGGIAKQLYQNANIQVKGFEKTTFPDRYFDLIISNVPFGSYKINDPKYNKYNFLIHDYFFAKSLDKVRPGGVIAFITSKGTMDKKNSSVREYISGKADLIGAIRLPNTAFAKNAGTRVTTDIIFLRKLSDGEQSKGESWITVGETSDGIPVNEYFTKHPEMMLGKMVYDESMYGNEKETALESDGRDIKEALSEAINKLPEKIYSKSTSTVNDEITVEDYVLGKYERENSMVVRNGQAFQIQNGRLSPLVTNANDPEKVSEPWPKTKVERVKGMGDIRNALKDAFKAQIEDRSESEISKAQKELNKIYDAFVKSKGYINSYANKIAFCQDPDYPLITTLEKYNPETSEYEKADVFTKRVITPTKNIEKAETISDALAVALNEYGSVNFKRMQELTGKNENDIINELKGQIFKNPATGAYETADEYLSGNVREKLRIAESEGIKENVDALKKVIPEFIKAKDISIRLGSNWVGQDIIQSFAREIFQSDGIHIHYVDQTGDWVTDISGEINESIDKTRWGTKLKRGIKILEDLLNLRQINVTVWEGRGESRHVNKEETKKATVAARQKADAIQKEYIDWIYKDTERRQKLENVYNEMFNSVRLRSYDGSFLKFNGLIPTFKPREYQNNSISRILFGGNTLLAHAVGAGKTAEMVISGMELKRMGIASKPMYVVPNHLIEQWHKTFLQLYPSANVLVATKKDFQKANRAKFISRIATGSWDAVVIAHGSFGKIAMSAEAEANFIQEEIDDVEEAIRQAKGSDDKNIEKQLANTRKKLEEKLGELADRTKRDDYLDFEELGVDYLFVDEAHNFKNLFFATKMGRIAGVTNSQAKRASDMYMKVKYITNLYNGNAGIVFASGTPVSNSMTEMFTMQRYLQGNKLEELGLKHFDAWASTFGEVKNVVEVDKTGKGFRTKQRFAKFFNAPELVKMFRQFADIITSEDLGSQIERPELEGGKPTIISVEPSKELAEYVESLIERAEDIAAGNVDKSEDNNLKVTNDGRLAALDLRLIDPSMPDDPNSKLNQAVGIIFDEWERGRKEKLTQFVFSDLGTPKDKSGKNTGDLDEANGWEVGEWYKNRQGAYIVKKISRKVSGGPVTVTKVFSTGVTKKDVTAMSNDDELTEAPEDFDYEEHGIQEKSDDNTPNFEVNFDIYNDIKNKLVKMGIPEDEVVFIHSAKTDEAKEKLFEKVRRGEVRILMGSTAKMGEGMNAQNRAVALHHLDAPWKPSSVEQRNGRIIRHGNINKKVRIYHYVTKSSFDAYIWQLIENKAKFITQIMSGNLVSRQIEDAFDPVVLNAAAAKAAASDDPRMLELFELNTKYSELELLKSNYQSKLYESQDNLRRLPVRIKTLHSEIEGFKNDLEIKQDTKGDKFNILLGKKRYSERKDAGESLINIIETLPFKEHIDIGKFAGFKLMVYKYTRDDARVKVVSDRTYEFSIPENPTAIGVISRLENVISDSNINDSIKWREKEIKSSEKQIDILNEEIKKPFSQEEEFRKVSDRKAQLEAELNLDRPDNSDIETEGDNEKDQGIEEKLKSRVSEALNPNDDVEYLGANYIPPWAKKGRGAGKGYSSESLDNYDGFSNAEIEQRWQEAKNETPGFLKKQVSKLDNLKETIAGHLFRGAFQYLYRGETFAELRFKLLNFQKGKDIAMYKTLKNLQGIVINLNPKQYDVFSRKIALDDMMEEVEAEHSLAFGFTPEILKSELDKINNVVGSEKEISIALNYRRELWDNIKADYIQSMKDIGFNVDNRFERKNYFRHLIKDYIDQDRVLTGTGKRLKTPTSAGYLKRREGSVMDYVSDYLQAESEVMAQMMYDMERAKLIKYIEKSEHNIIKQLRKQANRNNKGMINDIIERELMDPKAERDEAGLPISPTDKFIKQAFNKKMAIAFGKLNRLGIRGTLWEGENGEHEDAVTILSRDEESGEKLDIADETNKLFRYLSALAKSELDGAIEAATVLKYRSQRENYYRELLGDKYQTWEMIVPEDYGVWQARPGTAMYMTYSLPEKLSEALMTDKLEEIGITKDMLERTLTQGMPYRQMVLPKRVIATVEELYVDRNYLGIEKFAKFMSGKWKVWQLVSPPRVIKYNLRNLTGDADHVFAGNIHAFAKSLQATKELFDTMFMDKPMTKNLQDWFERGGMSTLMQVQELGDVNRLKMFIHLYEKKGKLSSVPLDTWKKYWSAVRLTTDFREAILRYADYLDIVEHGKKTGKLRNYGASIPDEINALKSWEDKAFKHSNELCGAYDDISVMGKYLRDRWIPFFSWMEVNPTIYKRLFQNAFRNDDLTSRIGKKVLGAGIKASFMLLKKIGKMVLATIFLTSIVQVWNELVHPDEEKDLPANVRAKSHIILGRDEEGNVLYFSRLGALSDLLEWAGLDTPVQDMRDIMNGNITLKEKARQMALSPANKIAGAAIPLEKTAVEAILQRTYYPDIDNPRSIRDQAEYIANSLGVLNEYKAIAGKPSKGYLSKNNILSKLLYVADPKESAFYDTLDTKRRFLESKGQTNEGFWQSPKSNALYNYKLSLKYQDADAAIKYLAEYKALGGTADGLERSLESMDPLYGLSEKKGYDQEFLTTLNDEEKYKLELATEYYNEVLNTSESIPTDFEDEKPSYTPSDISSSDISTGDINTTDINTGDISIGEISTSN